MYHFLLRYAPVAARLQGAVVLVWACLSLAGCPAEPARLGERVFVSGHTPGLQVVSARENYLSLQNAASMDGLRTGDILAGEEDGGFLRRVTGIHRQAGRLVAETEDARIEEAVESGIFAKDIVFTSTDFRNAGILPRDATLRAFQFDNIALYTGNGVAVSIERMSLDISPELNMAAYYSSHLLRRFSLLFDADIALEAVIRLGVDKGTHVLAERDLLPPVDHPFAARIGILPIAGNARFKLAAGIRGNFDGDTSLRTGFNVKTAFSAGGEFTRGRWERTLGFEPPDFSILEPVLTVELGGDLTFYILLETEVRLFDSFEAALTVSPFLHAHIEAYPAPFVYILDGGFQASGVSSVRLFGWQLFDESFDYVSPYREFAYFSGESW